MIVPHVPVAFLASGEVSVASLTCTADRCMVTLCVHSQSCMFKCTALRPYFSISLPFLQL